MDSVIVYVLYATIFFLTAFVLVIIGYAIGLFYSIWKGAPYISSGRKMAERMIEMAGVQDGMLVIDLGAGDGEICLAAARRGARAIGVDANPWLTFMSRIRARWLRSPKMATFVRADIWGYTLPVDTDVVCIYLLPHMYGRLWKKLREELRPGTKVVSFRFTFPGVEPIKSENSIFLYKI